MFTNDSARKGSAFLQNVNFCVFSMFFLFFIIQNSSADEAPLAISSATTNGLGTISTMAPSANLNVTPRGIAYRLNYLKTVSLSQDKNLINAHVLAAINFETLEQLITLRKSYELDPTEARSTPFFVILNHLDPQWLKIMSLSSSPNASSIERASHLILTTILQHLEQLSLQSSTQFLQRSLELQHLIPGTSLALMNISQRALAATIIDLRHAPSENLTLDVANFLSLLTPLSKDILDSQNPELKKSTQRKLLPQQLRSSVITAIQDLTEIMHESPPAVRKKIESLLRAMSKGLGPEYESRWYEFLVEQWASTHPAHREGLCRYLLR